MDLLPPLRRVASPSDPLGDEILDLFESLFPPEELEPREVIREEWSGSPFETWIVEEGGRVGGLCRGRVSPRGDWCWIVHVGLRADLRGRGWGAPLLLQGINAIAQGHPEVKGTILEVERAEDAPTPDDLDMRQRRLAFFAKLGAVELTSTYIQAPVRPGMPPVPLNLLWLPRSPETPDKPRLIEGFYQAAFDLSPSHPYVQSALGKMALLEALRSS